ncbi:MAG: class I SAM-dependent methyltransferase [Pontiellaceae bacterium]|jgi:ubiquinone/menaquinone biosynthesis C-methylase UbiE|nr:class I SAM-dependent methyltransferase [Pontiellaceae bacterium]
MKAVDWSAYAQEYDRMAQHNPAYQELVRHCVSIVRDWPLEPEDVVAEIGAGTGNFSIAVAQSLSGVKILHADFNVDMLKIAQEKAQQAALKNWRAVQLNVQEENWNLPLLGGIVAVHCLYSFQNPQRVIQKMCRQLKPGGFIYACDIGRVMSIWDWTLYLFRESVHEHGLRATLSTFMRSQEIRRQNQAVARNQKRGIYWTHNLAEFRASFEAAGIQVQHASDRWYRGYDDLIVGRKIEVK